MWKFIGDLGSMLERSSDVCLEAGSEASVFVIVPNQNEKCSFGIKIFHKDICLV